ARDIRQYRNVLGDINSFLSSSVGLNLRTFGFWFLRAPGHRSPDHRPPPAPLLHDIERWDPILLGPKLTSLHLFPDLCAHCTHDDLDAPTTPLRFFPWPCHVRQLAIEASDFFIADPINWHSQRALNRVRVAETLPTPYYDPALALQLARSILDALPAWATALTTLELSLIHFDHNVALALAQLSSLHQLDLHPMAVDSRTPDTVIDAQDRNLALADRRLEDHERRRGESLPPPLRIVLVPDHPAIAHSVEFDHLTELHAHEFFTLLKLCLPSLPLRVIHVGFTYSCILKPRDDFLALDGFTSRLATICPTLRFIHMGPHDVLYGCHAHVALDCSCVTNPIDLAPQLDPSCLELIHTSCGTSSREL
ncbi:hypothetical protein AURDEDRAFT_177631, partial [Auricularia subglabra TFB-10046 SS5]